MLVHTYTLVEAPTVQVSLNRVRPIAELLTRNCLIQEQLPARDQNNGDDADRDAMEVPNKVHPTAVGLYCEAQSDIHCGTYALHALLCQALTTAPHYLHTLLVKTAC